MTDGERAARAPRASGRTRRGRRARLLAGGAAAGLLAVTGVSTLASAASATDTSTTPLLSSLLPTGTSSASPLSTVPVVITGDGSILAQTLAKLVTGLGALHVGTLSLVNGVTARVPAALMPLLSTLPGVLTVTEDTGLHLLADNWNATTDQGSLHQVAANIDASPLYGAATPVTGAGIGVALIDSGVTPVPGLDQPGSVIQGPDLSFDSQVTAVDHLDGYGHGTHMAGIIAGRDSGSIADPSNPLQYSGIAPGAHIVNVKVATADGSTDVSQVIAAIGWVVQHKNDRGLNIRVLNLSFGSESTQPYTLDPLAFAAEQAWRQGIVVVVAAGNDGNTAGHLTDPAIDPDVIAVGASDPRNTASRADDGVATFSSGGAPGVRSPDLVAPGTSVASLRDPGSYIDTNYPTGRVTATSAPGGVDTSRLFRGSGTSQATAVTSGAVALLLQQRPGLTPDQVKALLTSTATKLPGVPATIEGAGLLDIAKASAAATPTTTQKSAAATGLGSLDLARGGSSLVDPTTGTALTGERDIFGNAWNASTFAAATIHATSWRYGFFLGQRWSGDSWNPYPLWSQLTWVDLPWTSDDWAGQPWSTNTYPGVAWNGQHWTGDLSAQHWTGQHWTGQHWTGQHWT